MEKDAAKLWFTSLTAGVIVGIDKIIMLIALVVFRIGWWATRYIVL
jgi:small-conductance mechanosensitive channel